ncbi:hypothetical protein GCM10023100_37010 [Actinocorallia cavernae]|uniref:Uncharacterized protein n=2 Tax=Actinomycetes TaxID=1760 RepID=A0ABN3MEG6_9ACTN
MSGGLPGSGASLPGSERESAGVRRARPSSAPGTTGRSRESSRQLSWPALIGPGPRSGDDQAEPGAIPPAAVARPAPC